MKVGGCRATITNGADLIDLGISHETSDDVSSPPVHHPPARPSETP
jgi:hypothetical protein